MDWKEDTINRYYKWDVDRLLEEAREKKEDALILREQMGDAMYLSSK